MVAADTPLRVKSNGVDLKLHLNDKWMSRPFRDAVLAPFIKAYNKKRPEVQVLPREMPAGSCVRASRTCEVEHGCALKLGAVAADEVHGICI